MKYLALAVWIFWPFITVFSQSSDFIHTSGKYILGPCGDTLRLKGINYAPYNWGYDLNDQRIAELAQTGANSVRLPWYTSDNTGAGIYDNMVALDSVLSKCVQHDLMIILEIHDFTCQDDPNSLISGSGWWSSPSVVTVLLKYKGSLIVNIANETLYVNWSGNPATALSTYENTYTTIIENLRNVSGFGFPLLIDAPDCGENSDAFVTANTATSLISSDPEHNLIFSTHAYWYAYANNDSTQMAAKVNTLQLANIPFVLGEVANLQDDQTMCQYTLNYQALLNYAEANQINWLAWSWDHDGCPQRQLSSDGTFANLTMYGNDLVNNPVYGMFTHPATKSAFLVMNGCGATAALESQSTIGFQVYPNPNKGVFYIQTDFVDFMLTCTDMLGKEIQLIREENGTYRVKANPGWYLLRVRTGSDELTRRLWITD